MRFLHTSDWHIGKTVGGRSRMPEFKAALDEVVGIAKQEKVDCVLVSGDLCDQRIPSTDSDALLFGTFISLFEADIRVVAIPGNHDSAARFSALEPLLSKIGVTVVPKVRSPLEGGHVVVPARDGRSEATIACIPFVPERLVDDAASLFAAGENWYISYAEKLGKLFTLMTAGFDPKHVNILMAHVFTDGALLSGDEREIRLGAAYAVSPSRLPGNASYIALGHVHMAQAVKGAPAATRYAGSLLQLDFGEADQVKSVYVVEANPGQPARVDAIPLKAGRRMLTVSGTLAEINAQRASLGDAHLRVVVKTDGPVPGMNERVLSMMPNAVQVAVAFEPVEPETPEVSVAGLQPREQFLAYYRKSHKAEPAEDILAAFDEVLAIEMERR
jgi:exonuclease SbcD